jgi:F-type H+-transporting ATPase subunit epsilon
MATMHVEVVSAEQHVLSADISELYARSVEGEIGILPGHQPAVIALDIGAVRLVMEDGSRERVAVHRGVLYVDQDNKVIVLADIAELASRIDVERAEERKRDLERRLAESEDAYLRSSLRKQDLRLAVARGEPMGAERS